MKTLKGILIIKMQDKGEVVSGEDRTTKNFIR